MQRFANPALFASYAIRVSPWAGGLAFGLLALGTWLGLGVAPADYQQGETVRIMFVHVPAAWMAMFCYAVMAVSSATGLIWNHPLAHLAAKCTAPVGAVFTFLALATGSLWGKPMWGAWWVWDARLTSVLILLFLYLGYISLWWAIEESTRATRATAILALVGAVNLPVIKFSVDWWNTLHQPASVIRLDGPAIHPAILTPLMIMAVAFTVLYFWLLLIRMRSEILARQVRRLQMDSLSQ